MIILYRDRQSPFADHLEHALREMVIAFRVEIVGPAHKTRFDALPALADGDDLVMGEEALMERLALLRRWMRDWDRFTSDACFLDESGEIC